MIHVTTFKEALMPGTLAAIIITVIFFKTALDAGKNPVHKAFTGFLAFFIPALLWTYFVTPDLKDTLQHDPSNTLLKLTANYAYALLGSVCSVWVWFKIFKS